MTEVVLDAGALIAVERHRSVLVRDLLRLALRGEVRLVTSSAVVAQVWREPARQARLARVLRVDAVREVALDPVAGRAIGRRLAGRVPTDVVDGHVAELADRPDVVSVLTSDVGDLAALGVARERLHEV